jgi:hypothetical protein
MKRHPEYPLTGVVWVIAILAGAAMIAWTIYEMTRAFGNPK